MIMAIDMHRVVSPLVDEHLKNIARLRFFQRRLEIARKYRMHREIEGYEAHVCRSLDLLWKSQTRLQWGKEYFEG